MSDTEEFDLGVSSGSEDFQPKAKKAPAKAKAPSSSKPAPRAKAATAPKKKAGGKALKSIEDKKDESEDDTSWVVKDDKQSDGELEAAPAARKNKGASEMYEKLTQLQHILKRPDTYIGSIESITQKMWTFDAETKRMVYRDVTFVPGLFKIVDEILVNAADNKINDASMDTIKVDIDVENGTISVYNNGKGIPIEIHSKEKIYIPEMIFGHLLTSSNYDDDEKKLTGGRNGYGAKLTNIYSTEFTIDTADKNTGQKYKQTWTDNMSKPGKAKITKNPRGEEYTKVSFKPDFKRFGMDGIDEDTAAVLRRRVYDMAGTVKNIKVLLNGERIKIKTFKQYVELYVNSARGDGEDAGPKPTIVFEEISPRWEVAFTLSEGSFQHISFANSIATTKGGTHVNLIAEQISKNLIAGIEKKNKNAKVKPQAVKNQMWVFVNALIENPAFDSQTKEWLTLPASKFGSRPHVSEDFMKKVAKSGIIDNVLNWAKFKADQENKKTDGHKRTRLTGIAKLSDANNAGGRQSQECTLILTEGDSAKSLAEAGLSVVGRNNFGIFPLRGKLLNVREANHDQVMKNGEIQAIKQIMGLKHGMTYKDTNSLRYGSIMIMTDQDHDGSHIKGLLINFLDYFYPSLLKIPEFLVEFVTPIVRVTKGNQKINFFTIPEFQQWNEENNRDGKWYVKYYKGLGTSKDSDAREYFSAMEKHMIPFAKTEEGERELIDMAFNKKKADNRKDWLRHDFINRELILFSMADNIRSIPSVVDGLKPGQRKVIFSCFKRKLKNEIKVAQLIGYVSEKTAYHHGEQSLTLTIVNLAQNFVGSNNINLLKPEGQFGTRSQGGKDAASARYIFTNIPRITRAIFHPYDDALLNYLKDDNDSIEPEWYMPVIPLVLINGADGIGTGKCHIKCGETAYPTHSIATGWSTSIPNYNPADIVDNLKRLMRGEPQVPMTPWYRGFKGTIEKIGEDKYKVSGIVERTNSGVDIKELPIRIWTQNYKEQIEEWLVGTDKVPQIVKDYHEHHTTRSVHFELILADKDVAKAEAEGLEKFFKLVGQISTSNMICFDVNGKIKKYRTPEEILEEFYPLRLSYYQKRKQHMCDELERQFEKLSNQARFVHMIIKKELVVSNKKKADLCTELRNLDFRPFPKVRKAKDAGENEDAQEEEEEQPVGANSDYDYLLGMAIWSLTREKVEKLLAEQATKEEEWNALLKRKPIELWDEDLNQFLKAWEDMLEEDVAAEVGTSKKKGAKLRTRKSVAGKKNKRADSGSEDNFRPAKAPAKRKPAAEKAPEKVTAPTKPTAKIEEMDEDEAPAVIKKKPVASSSKLKKEESDSDAPVVKVSATSKGKAKAVVKRKSEEDEEDSDAAPVRKVVKKQKAQSSVMDFFDSKPATKPAPKAKAPPKKVISSDDDDSMMILDDTLPSPPVKRATRPAAKAKSKYVDLSTDGDDDDDDAYAISD
ncbi:DNA topoisomerase 2 [Ceratobasidium sp. 414]|nr:DNA topoisomerase 2 [Ceratobasidium sp. 414]